MSISGKQAKLVNSGGLNNLGSTDRGDKLQLNRVTESLVKMAENLITQAQKNLNKAGSTSTGGLEASIHASDIDIDGSRLSVDILLLDRYKFIDQGVSGVESGKGKYSFKTKYPSKKMATAILKWLRQGRNRALSIRKPLGGKTEKKNLRAKKAVNESDNLKSLAYAISTNIKKKGIKPTYFFEKAVKDTEKKWKKEIANGFKLDIIESLK